MGLQSLRKKEEKGKELTTKRDTYNKQITSNKITNKYRESQEWRLSGT